MLGGAGVAAGGVAVEVVKVFSMDRVLQRLAEQIIEDDILGRAGFNSASWSRTARRASGGAVLREKTKMKKKKEKINKVKTKNNKKKKGEKSKRVFFFKKKLHSEIVKQVILLRIFLLCLS